MKLGYFDIIKQGIKTGNRNLMVLLTQFLAGISLLIVLAIIAATLAFSAIGSLANFDVDRISPDNILDLFRSSASLVVMIVIFGLIFIALAAVITSYVHAGNLGCIIETAKGKAGGFQFSTFFSSGNRSVMSMLGLYIVWLFIVGATFLVFGAFAGAGLYAVLVPLKDAGRNILAFGLGVPFFVVLIIAAFLCFFVLFAFWTFSGIILVGEKLGAFKSIGAAYRFIKKNFWDFFLFALLMLGLSFVANLATNLISMPFSFKAETDPAMAFALLPLLFISIFLQMYVGLLARASFAVYYAVHAARPEGTAPVQPPAPTAEPSQEVTAAGPTQGPPHPTEP